jgi:hypothetical protein
MQWCSEPTDKAACLFAAHFASSNHHISSPPLLPPQGFGGGAITVDGGHLDATSCAFKNSCHPVVRCECDNVLLQSDVHLFPSSPTPLLCRARVVQCAWVVGRRP